MYEQLVRTIRWCDAISYVDPQSVLAKPQVAYFYMDTTIKGATDIK